MTNWPTDPELEKHNRELMDNAFFVGYITGCLCTGIAVIIGKIIGLI